MRSKLLSGRSGCFRYHDDHGNGINILQQLSEGSNRMRDWKHITNSHKHLLSLLWLRHAPRLQLSLPYSCWDQRRWDVECSWMRMARKHSKTSCMLIIPFSLCIWFGQSKYQAKDLLKRGGIMRSFENANALKKLWLWCYVPWGGWGFRRALSTLLFPVTETGQQ